MAVRVITSLCSLRTIALRRGGFGLALLLSCGVASAQSSSAANVNAVAGLLPVLQLVCTDIDFGVWRVQTRDSVQASTVELDDKDTTTLGGQAVGLSKANTTRQPVAGTCTVSGSQAGNGQKIKVSLASAADLDFDGSNDSDLGRPNAAATMRANFSVPNTVTVNGGSGSFKVWGKLTVPARIIRENYGAYVSIAPVQVQVIDAAQP
jgi:hypothetical protein